MICGQCGGSGYRIVEVAGHSGAEICSCRKKAPQPSGPPPSPTSIAKAVERMARGIKFFPADPASHGDVIKLLAQMVNTEAELEELVETAVNEMRGWDHIAGLREIFCRQFTPRDGRKPSKPSDQANEIAAAAARYFQIQCDETDARIAAYKQEAKLLNGGVEPPPEGLPAVKPMPPAKASSSVFRDVPYSNGAGFSLQREKPTPQELEAEVAALAEKQRANRRSAEEMAREIEILEARLRLKNEDSL